MTKPVLVVMAAGIGNRYGGLKQIDPVGPHGESIMDYSVFDALRAGFDRVVFVIKEEIQEIFREKLGKHIEKRIKTDYVRQRLDNLPPDCRVPSGRVKPWGTAHAVLSAGNAVTEPFAVINADDFYGPASYRILHEHLISAGNAGRVGDYCMIGYLLGHTLTANGQVARGVCTVDARGNLLAIKEHTRIERRGGEAVFAEDGENWTAIPEDSIVSMNMWGFTPDIFAQLEQRFPGFLADNGERILEAEYFLPDVVASLIAEGKAGVRVYRTDERWFGVTYRQDKELVQAALERAIAQGVYPRRLWEEI